MSAGQRVTGESRSASPTVAEVIRTFQSDYLASREGKVPSVHHEVLNAIGRCRTEAMGGHRYRCPDCGYEHYVYHACRNRHCPQCQRGEQQKWLQARLKELPPIEYFHVTFTIPSELNPIFLRHPRRCYGLLFRASSRTLLEFGRNNLEAKLGLIGLLHTWGQQLNYHPHVHYLVSRGGLSLDGQRWVKGSGNFLFPKGALQKVFRGKLMEELDKADWLEDEWRPSLLKAKGKVWSVDIRRPRGDPRRLLLYLARYTYRVAIDDRRVSAIDRERGRVRFSYKDYARKGARRDLWLSGVEFVRRFLLHVLPKGFVKARYYGLFAHGQRKVLLAKARERLRIDAGVTRQTLWCLEALLATIVVPPVHPRCPRCGRGQMEWIEELPARRIDKPLKPP